MTATFLALWLVGAVGLVQVVTRSGLFVPVRGAVARRSNFFGLLVACPLCFGVWAGWAGALVLPSPFWLAFGPDTWPGTMGPLAEWSPRWLLRIFYALLDGCAASAAAWGWETLRTMLDRVGVHHPGPAYGSTEPGYHEATVAGSGRPYSGPFDPEGFPISTPAQRAALQALLSEPAITLAVPEDDGEEMRAAEWAARAAQVAFGASTDCSTCGGTSPPSPASAAALSNLSL